LNPIRLSKALFSRLIASTSITDKDIFNVASFEDDYIWKLPKKEDYLADMRKLNTRDVKNLYIFTGSVVEYYNYQDQFKDSFKGEAFIDSIQVKLFPKAGHTFRLMDDRKKMMELVSNWLGAFRTQ